MLSDAAVRDYLERLVPLQEDWEETRDRLTEIKRDARSDGLNFDVVNALLPVLSKYPHDKGAGILSDIIRYAEAYGTEGLLARGDGEAQPSADRPAGADLPRLPEATTPPAADVRPRRLGSRPLRLSTQIAASLCVTFGLLWLLN